MGPIINNEVYEKTPARSESEKAHWLGRQIKILCAAAIGKTDFEKDMIIGLIEIFQRELRKIDLPRIEE